MPSLKLQVLISTTKCKHPYASTKLKLEYFLSFFLRGFSFTYPKTLP